MAISWSGRTSHYGQFRKELMIIQSNLTSQGYTDQILHPVVVPIAQLRRACPTHKDSVVLTAQRSAIFRTSQTKTEYMDINTYGVLYLK